MSFFSEDFSPTFEEWLWYHVPSPDRAWNRWENQFPWGPRDDEKALYHAVDLTLAGTAFGIHAARHGAYAATNTLHFYRLARAMRFPFTAMGALTLAVPLAQTLGDAINYYAPTNENTTKFGHMGRYPSNWTNPRT